MPRAAGGASAPPSSFASLERTLDRTIDCLVRGPQNREARALLIEARRLRSVVANWRSIPPSTEIHDEMLQRVVQLSTGVGAAFPEALPEIAAALTEGSPMSGDEETEGYALDFEPQLYSLEAATNPNRHAAPLNDGAAGGPKPRAPAEPLPPPVAERAEAEPLREATEPAPPLAELPPAAEAAAPESLPANSEDEPTRAWNNASVRPPPDFEASEPAPAPWPVDEPPDRISSVVAIGREGGDPGRTSVLPAGAARPEAPEAPRAPAAAPRQPALSSPDAEGGAGAPRVITYEFDPEGDDLSVPRTQIVAHPVKLSDPVDPQLVVLTDAYSPRADAYRTLRRKLATTPAARVLGVTSAEPGEGKTVFAVNLALTLRESARSRVLLVEANLRSPSLGKLLGFDTPACFIEQIKRHADDPRAPWVVAEPLPKLHVMAIDPRTPHEPVLDPVTFSMAMERLKQAGYEYVVVDSPPVLGSLDCNVISDAVDAMILTALSMKSRRRQMRKAVEQLEPAPILGVVVLEA